MRAVRHLAILGTAISDLIQAMGKDQIEDLKCNRPHVFLLGAGASVAAFPGGDVQGHRLPTMADFIEVLELEPLLAEAGVWERGQNFESVYSDLHDNQPEVASRIQEHVRDYFSRLALPPEPTLYDRLLVTLRAKDFVATFNWDPFLFDALARNAWRRKSLPRILFLHGNVRVGYCPQDACAGRLTGVCRECRNPFIPTRLLFPVKKKGYMDDPYTHNQWQKFRVVLDSAYLLTIFGFGAPASDVEAIELMEEAWGASRPIIAGFCSADGAQKAKRRPTQSRDNRSFSTELGLKGIPILGRSPKSRRFRTPAAA